MKLLDGFIKLKQPLSWSATALLNENGIQDTYEPGNCYVRNEHGEFVEIPYRAVVNKATGLVESVIDSKKPIMSCAYLVSLMIDLDAKPEYYMRHNGEIFFLSEPFKYYAIGINDIRFRFLTSRDEKGKMKFFVFVEDAKQDSHNSGIECCFTLGNRGPRRIGKGMDTFIYYQKQLATRTKEIIAMLSILYDRHQVEPLNYRIVKTIFSHIALDIDSLYNNRYRKTLNDNEEISPKSKRLLDNAYALYYADQITTFDLLGLLRCLNQAFSSEEHHRLFPESGCVAEIYKDRSTIRKSFIKSLLKYSHNSVAGCTV